MTHTKGPSIHDTEWRAMQMGSEGWAVFAGPRMLASHLTEANARLIAAAPELLEALQEALGSVEFMAGATDADPEDHERLALVKAAIAKAGGEQ